MSEQYAIRLGYGLSPHHPAPEEPAALLASTKAVGPEKESMTMDKLRKIRQPYRENRKKARNGNKAAREIIKRIDWQTRNARWFAKQRRIARAAAAPVGFGERLVHFWADHFTVSDGGHLRTLVSAIFVEEAIRPYIGGNFADMLFAASTHPRMLRYLTQNSSIGPNSELAKERKEHDLGLNENLAREIIELHSLGVGAAYTQKDVRQLAELLTGLNFNLYRDKLFLPQRAEPGVETVLGQNYGGDGRVSIEDIRTVLHDLARHDATAGHIARKLAVHFVADDPPQNLVERLAAAFRESRGELSSVYKVLIEAPELAQNFRQKVRQPLDYMVASVRALGLGEREIMTLKPKQFTYWLIRPLAIMGQKWNYPTGPNGWPETAENWATPQGLAARIDWAGRIPAKLMDKLPDPQEFLTTALGETASEELRWAVPKAESIREGVTLVLASTDFNRR